MKHTRAWGTVGAVAAQLCLTFAVGGCGGNAESDPAPSPTSAASDPVSTTTGAAGSSSEAGVGGSSSSGGGGGSTTAADTSHAVTGGGAASTTGGSAENAANSTSPCSFGCDCQSESRPIDMDDATRFTFSANDVLAFAGGTKHATLTYGPTDLGVATVAFPAETTTLELQIEPLGTASDIIKTDCTNVLGIDVKGTLTSEDGAFAEEFTTILMTTPAGFAKLEFAELSVPLSLAGLRGSYAPEIDPDDHYTVELSDQLRLIAHFGRGVFAGELLADYTSCYDGYCTPASGARISTWGYCPFGGFELDVSEDPRVTLADALDTWDSMPELEALWAEDSTRSPLTLELDVEDARLCRESDRYRFQAPLTLSTADGRVDTQFGVDVEYLFDDYSRTLSMKGPSGEGDPLVESFYLDYTDYNEGISIILNGAMVLTTESGAYEEIWFQ